MGVESGKIRSKSLCSVLQILVLHRRSVLRCCTTSPPNPHFTSRPITMQSQTEKTQSLRSKILPSRSLKTTQNPSCSDKVLLLLLVTLCLSLNSKNVQSRGDVKYIWLWPHKLVSPNTEQTCSAVFSHVFPKYCAKRLSSSGSCSRDDSQRGSVTDFLADSKKT